MKKEKKRKSFKGFIEFLGLQKMRWIMLLVVVAALILSVESGIVFLQYFYGVILVLAIYLNYRDYVKWL